MTTRTPSPFELLRPAEGDGTTEDASLALMVSTECCVNLLNRFAFSVSSSEPLKISTRRFVLMGCLTNLKRVIYYQFGRGDAVSVPSVPLSWFKLNIVDALFAHCGGDDVLFGIWFNLVNDVYQSVSIVNGLSRALSVLDLAIDWFCEDACGYFKFAHKLCMYTVGCDDSCGSEFTSLVYFIYTLEIATRP